MKFLKKKEKESEEQKESRFLLNGVPFERKKIKFDKFESTNGDIRLHVNIRGRKRWRYLFYNRSIQDGVTLTNAYIENGWLYLGDCRQELSESYESGADRYTFIAVDDKKQCAYVFAHTAAGATNEYDHMSNMMYSERIGENQNQEYIEGIFYLADTDKVLRMVVRREYKHLEDFLSAKVDHLELKGDKLCLQFHFKNYGYEIFDVSMKLRSPTEDVQYAFNLNVERKENIFYVTAKLALKKLKLAQFYWDIKGVVRKDNIEYPIKLMNKDLWMHRIMYLKQMHYVYKDGNIVYPYKTKSNEFALQYRPKTEYDNWGFIFKEYIALAIYYLTYPWLKRRNLWLVYEKYCVMAQDNGFYFFKYCMENLPEKERKRIFYVIDKKEPDYQYVKQYDSQVLDFLSIKHMVYLMAARLLISSDTKAHAYAWHSPNSIYRNMLKRKENVFLQHGVISFKCCHKGLRKKSVNASNLFVVSSEEEKQIILDYFGYNEDQIIVTGLARWDVLEDKSKGQPKQIILMPTWRTWLEEVTEEEFKNSEYYKHYMDLLNHPVLLNTLEKYDIMLNFYIHPKFREYLGAFHADNSHIRIIPFGSEPLNELMMKCSMMITDYSSAVWDVFYQGKPVAFYLFDLEMYNEVQGSYIDMNTDVFGDVAYNPEGLSEIVQKYAENGFKEDKKYTAMRKYRIAYIDDKNSERTYKEIAKRYPTSLQ